MRHGFVVIIKATCLSLILTSLPGTIWGRTAEEIKELCREARKIAEKDVENMPESGTKGFLPSLKVHATHYVKPEIAKDCHIFDKTCHHFFALSGYTAQEVEEMPIASEAFGEVMDDICPTIVSTCNASYGYRLIDGSCNNLEHPEWGMAFTPQKRLVSVRYDDGLGAPRTYAKDNSYLPSPRTISVKLHRNTVGTPEHKTQTHMTMQWGQFTDHDLIISPVIAAKDGSKLQCCERDKYSPDCIPIKIEQPDPRFVHDCMELERTLPAISIFCRPGHREQLNFLTSCIDSSNIYGSSQEELDILREYKDGLMKSVDSVHLPRDPEQESCNSPSEGNNDPYYCAISGDARVHEQPGLSVMHTSLFRFHNVLVRELKQMNSHWDDEKLFQEGRKMVAAVAQHITYNEFLPAVFGRSQTRKFRFKPKRFGFNNVYKKDVDPTIVNDFAAAAYRFGHSQVYADIGKSGDNYDVKHLVELKDHFFEPDFFQEESGEGGSDICRWQISTSAKATDRELAISVVDHLFEDKTDRRIAFDLAAINIQRGRDHGIGTYNDWRIFCGLPKVEWWGTAKGGLVDHDPQTAAILEELYKHPDDIDLFPGGISEKPIKGALLGRTFACIVGGQFQRLRDGDRFYYENFDPVTGFTAAQLREIRKMSLSKVLCDTMSITSTQKWVMFQPNRRNCRRPCSSFPTMNMEAWRDGTSGNSPSSWIFRKPQKNRKRCGRRCRRKSNLR